MALRHGADPMALDRLILIAHGIPEIEPLDDHDDNVMAFEGTDEAERRARQTLLLRGDNAGRRLAHRQSIG